MPAPRGANTESEIRFCKKQGKETEFRRHKVERKWAKDDNGEWYQTDEYRYQWRCIECMAAVDLKRKKEKGVDVGRNARVRARKEKEAAEKAAAEVAEAKAS